MCRVNGGSQKLHVRLGAEGQKGQGEVRHELAGFFAPEGSGQALGLSFLVTYLLSWGFLWF